MEKCQGSQTRWDLKTWTLVIVAIGCVIVGGVIGVILGTSLAIWLVEGGDPFKEFIYAHPGSGELTLARGFGLILGAALGGGVSGFVALFFLFMKLRPSDGSPGSQ